MPTLHWIGKEQIVNHHAEVPFRVLEHQYGFRGKDPADRSETHSGNKIIHGDNLEALKALLPEYEGKIDCIYIDPPYNTGNEGWVYNDNVNDPRIRKWLGEVVGAEGEDLSRHDKWLCMMYPRLQLMRQLLSENGVIFISCDDNEGPNLRKLLDEIFGSTNFVSNISWQRTYSIRADSKGIMNEVESILAYSKYPNWSPNRLERTEEMNEAYKSPDNDPNRWASVSILAPGASTHQGMVYAIQNPFSGEMMYPSNGRCWSFSQNDMLRIMNEWCSYVLCDIHDEEKRAGICGLQSGQVRQGVKAIVLGGSLEESRAAASDVMHRGNWPVLFFTKNGEGSLRRKTYMKDVQGNPPSNLFKFSEVGHTDEAKKELKRIFEGNIPFDTPKPSRLVQRIVEIATNECSVVLDCFAGSGTTAHAVLQQNKKDHGNRKFLLVEMMDYAESTTAERVRRVITGYPFQGKREEEIFCQKLTAKNLAKGAKLIEEAEQAIEANKWRYDKISKPKIEDNCLKVIGTLIYKERMEGLGGAFDFYELGDPLFLADGSLNEQVGIDKMREYIYYTETHQHLSRPQEADHPYLLDYWDGTGYFFFYEPDCLTVLSDDTLYIVPERADHYVIYADTCAISPERLAAMNISFKKIPRDIQKF